MMALNLATMHGVVVKEIASQRTLAESMNRIIARCAKGRPHEDWETLAALPYGDLNDLRRGIETPFREEPSKNALAGLWFGLFNSTDSNKPVAGLTVSGSTRFDPNPDDNSWAVDPDWWPEARDAHSSVMLKVCKIAYRNGGLGNDAEYPLCLAYGGLAVRDLLRAADPLLFLHSSPSLGIAVGFDSGDFVLVGTLSKTGLVGFS